MDNMDTLVRKARHASTISECCRNAVEIESPFYLGAAESILTGSSATWFGNSCAQDRRALLRIEHSDEHTIGTILFSLQDSYQEVQLQISINILHHFLVSSDSVLRFSGKYVLLLCTVITVSVLVLFFCTIS